MVSGRKPGFKHSEETRNKMRNSHLGKPRDANTREKISKSLSGQTKPLEHRDAISEGRSDLDKKCMSRFLEMRNEYPEHREFFDRNQSELLFAMRSIKSEKEIRDISRYIESVNIESVPPAYLSYQYSSSSFYAQEDAMIALLDHLAFLKKVLSTNN